MTKILVIDDHPAMVEMVGRALKSLGFTDVAIEKDGERAIERMMTAQFDLVISDWDMFPITGTELYNQMRAMDAYKHVPFILLTAHDAEPLEDHFAGDDLAIILNKPFDGKKMRHAIEALL